jgi:hypothetical protein
MSREANSFTTEELEKIDQLRKRVTKDLELREDQVSDHYLIRWLRARSLNVSKAEEMLRKSLQWRKENGVDTILETAEIPEHLKKRMFFGYLGIDPVSELPVMLFLLGRFDIARDIEEVGAESLFRCNIYFMEYIQKVIFK